MPERHFHLIKKRDSDQPMMVWINNHRHPLFDHFFEAVTWAGSLAALLPLPMLVLGFLLYRGKAADAWMLGVGFGGAVLLTHLLKMVFGRPRPSLSPVLVSMPTDFSLCETSFSEPGIKDISAAAVGIGIVLGDDNRGGNCAPVAPVYADTSPADKQCSSHNTLNTSKDRRRPCSPITPFSS